MSEELSANRYKLEVLSGLHRGVEQWLEPGDYLVGSAFRCDLVFSDGAISDRHCTLKLDAQSASVLPLGGLVRINGQAVEEETLIDSSVVYIELGTVTLALESFLPEPKSLKERFSRKLTLPKRAQNNAANQQFNLEDELPELDSVFASPVQRWTRKVGAVAIIAAVALVVFIVLTGGLRTPEPPKDISGTLRAELLRYDISNIKIEHSNNYRSWLVRVYDLVDDATLTQAASTLSAQHPGLELRRVPTEVIRAQTQALLDNFDSPIQVRRIDQGVVYLEGRVQASEDYERVSESIVADVPDVNSVNTDGLVVVTDAAAYFRQRLTESGLEDIPEIQIDNDTLWLEIPESWVLDERWQDALVEFRARYLPLMDVKTGLIGSTEPKVPQIAMQGIYFGDSPYILMDDGEPRFIGSDLQNGWTIEAITPDAVTLRRGGDKIELKI
ncbi:MAG: type III secretion system inner membrane ring subunit SctD [Gammaproteobacteria bacterium]|nr:type III secretion system inner membrane ring subunit SctD [Gammaproteobacteria bacterium]